MSKRNAQITIKPGSGGRIQLGIFPGNINGVILVTSDEMEEHAEGMFVLETWEALAMANTLTLLAEYVRTINDEG